MKMSRARTILSFVTATSLSAGIAVASPGGTRPTRPASRPPATSTATRTTPAATTTTVATPAAAATPLVAANGRPACGNTLSKSGSSGRRAMVTYDLEQLAKLIEHGVDADHLAERDRLITEVRNGLFQVEACDTPAVPEAPEYADLMP